MSTQITIREPKIILWSNYMDDFAKISRINRIINSYPHVNNTDDDTLGYLMAQEIDDELSRMLSEFK